MRKAHAIIGAWYGDEGKGLMTDYLANKHNATVVRFNGGAQAGHTVVTPEGKRHVFHHFGSGTLAGSPTHLSRYFIVNPFLFVKEYTELVALGITPKVSVSPECLITTPWDMAINQELEKARSSTNHGSVGVGIFETIQRSKIEKFKLTVGDRGKVNVIRNQYYRSRCVELGLQMKDHLVNEPYVIANFLDALDFFLGVVEVSEEPIGNNHLVFEGAQGLMLDEQYGVMPHCTPSNCGLKNVAVLAREWGICDIEAVYVSRSYLTRHGSGPILNEADFILQDDTNVEHEYQGTLRFGTLPVLDMELDINDMLWNSKIPMYIDYAIHAREGYNGSVAITHLDQYDDGLWRNYMPKYSIYGNTRNDVFE